MFDWSDMIFTTSTHIWTKVISIIIRCPEDYHLSSPVQSPIILRTVTYHDKDGHHLSQGGHTPYLEGSPTVPRTVTHDDKDSHPPLTGQ